MIRPANLDDATRIAEIHIFGWRAAYRGIISDEYLFAKLSVSKRILSLKKALEEKAEETYVLEDQGIIKGFMTLGPSRNEDKRDAFELWGIYVDPLLTGIGIGTEMVRFFEFIARERAYTETILWVFKDNTRSRGF